MAINHGECDHARTPAERAKCRRRQETMAGIVEDGHQEAVRVLDAGQPTRARNNPRKAVSGDLKRPGTFLRATHDLADVPRRLTPAIRTAWGKKWHVRVGQPYNETERRIEILAPYGVASLVWKDGLPNGIWGVFWRNTGNPITRRIDNVNLAIRLAAGEEEL